MKEANTIKQKECIKTWCIAFDMDEQKLLRNQIPWQMLYHNLEVQGYRWNVNCQRWERRTLPWALRACKRK